MNAIRLMLGFVACAVFGIVSVIAQRYASTFILLSSACFWVFGFSIVYLQWGGMGSDHVLRWLPFYLLVVVAGILAIIESMARNKRGK